MSPRQPHDDVTNARDASVGGDTGDGHAASLRTPAGADGVRPTSRPHRPRRRRLLLTVLGVAGIALGVIAMARLWFGAEVSGDGQTCGHSTLTTGTTVADRSVLIPAGGEQIGFTWVFGSDETVHRMRTVFQWDDPISRPAPLLVGDRLGVRVPAELANAARDHSIPGDQVNTLATVTATGVELNVCVDASGVGPGRYSGALTFEDPQVRSTPYVIDVVVKNRAEWMPLAAIVVGIAVALIVLVLSLACTESPMPLTGVLALVLGAVVVMVGTAKPWAMWTNDPTWGDDPFLDWLALAAATAFALMGAVAAGDTVQGIRSALSAKSPASEVGGSRGGS